MHLSWISQLRPHGAMPSSASVTSGGRPVLAIALIGFLHDIDGRPRGHLEAARVLEPSGCLCAAIPHPINTAGAFQGSDAAAPFVIFGSYLDRAPALAAGPWRLRQSAGAQR